MMRANQDVLACPSWPFGSSPSRATSTAVSVLIVAAPCVTVVLCCIFQPKKETKEKSEEERMEVLGGDENTHVAGLRDADRQVCLTFCFTPCLLSHPACFTPCLFHTMSGFTPCLFYTMSIFTPCLFHTLSFFTPCSFHTLPGFTPCSFHNMSGFTTCLFHPCLFHTQPISYPTCFTPAYFTPSPFHTLPVSPLPISHPTCFVPYLFHSCLFHTQPVLYPTCFIPYLFHPCLFHTQPISYPTCFTPALFHPCLCIPCLFHTLPISHPGCFIPCPFHTLPGMSDASPCLETSISCLVFLPSPFSFHLVIFLLVADSPKFFAETVQIFFIEFGFFPLLLLMFSSWEMIVGRYDIDRSGHWWVNDNCTLLLYVQLAIICTVICHYSFIKLFFFLNQKNLSFPLKKNTFL